MHNIKLNLITYLILMGLSGIFGGVLVGNYIEMEIINSYCYTQHSFIDILFFKDKILAYCKVTTDKLK